MHAFVISKASVVVHCCIVVERDVKHTQLNKMAAAAQENEIHRQQ